MSQCLAPDCETKTNYLECKQREDGGTCTVSGPGAIGDASCNSKIANEHNWNRADIDCQSKIDQDNCEEINGCVWTYENSGASQKQSSNFLKKICKKKTGISSAPLTYTCGEDPFGQGHDGRYNLIEPDTFGCDKIKCN